MHSQDLHATKSGWHVGPIDFCHMLTRALDLLQGKPGKNLPFICQATSTVFPSAPNSELQLTRNDWTPHHSRIAS